MCRQKSLAKIRYNAKGGVYAVALIGAYKAVCSICPWNYNTAFVEEAMTSHCEQSKSGCRGYLDMAVLVPNVLSARSSLLDLALMVISAKVEVTGLDLPTNTQIS